MGGDPTTSVPAPQGLSYLVLVQVPAPEGLSYLVPVQVPAPEGLSDLVPVQVPAPEGLSYLVPVQVAEGVAMRKEGEHYGYRAVKAGSSAVHTKPGQLNHDVPSQTCSNWVGGDFFFCRRYGDGDFRRRAATGTIVLTAPL
eukprot:gene30979-38841_t